MPVSSSTNMAAAINDNEKKEKKIGLALCGGIFVASAGGAATMRGFQQQSIVVDGEERPALEAFDYVSGLSGESGKLMVTAWLGQLKKSLVAQAVSHGLMKTTPVICRITSFPVTSTMLNMLELRKRKNSSVCNSQVYTPVS